MFFSIPSISSFEPMLENPFPAFDNSFPPWTWEGLDILSPIQSPNPMVSSSGSDEPNQNQTNSNSGSDEPNQPVSIIDERKKRRMISNRESARRSRMRKQKHVENLRNQVNRLRIENRELTNRLRFVMYHCHRVRTDNDRLQSEHSMLRQKLLNICQILRIRQLQQYTSAWPCNTVTSDITPSLIA